MRSSGWREVVLVRWEAVAGQASRCRASISRFAETIDPQKLSKRLVAVPVGVIKNVAVKIYAQMQGKGSGMTTKKFINIVIDETLETMGKEAGEVTLGG